MTGAILTFRDITADVDVECDVCVIGSGAGGAVLAEGLVSRGLRVIMLEEGSHHTNADFDMQEGHAFPMLYQERGGRATADLAIAILQGRAVGGTTVINWTTCYRTPDRILEHWRSKHGIEGLDPQTLAPHFDAIEQRLNITEWPPEAMNANNRVLWDGCKKLGWEVTPLRRNVNGCANSGYCGLGCPVNGKQSMLVTYVPDAVQQGLTLYANTRADRLEYQDQKIVAVHATVRDPADDQPNGRKITVRPKVVAVCGGAINSPALLLRSDISEGGVGRRTWLHPVVAIIGFHEHDINGFYGAPQSVGSHQFIDRGPDKVGFFLETPPMQPMLSSLAFTGFGAARHQVISQLPRINTLIALSVDGLLPGDEGGTVSLRSDGRVSIDYPVGPALQESFRESSKVMAEIALAAGATRASSLHLQPIPLKTKQDIALLDAAPWGALEHPIFTAHQMGGCTMGVDPQTSVVDPTLRHHRYKNLFVVDGSVFPTALGVNPSETIYGLAHWATDTVASAI